VALVEGDLALGFDNVLGSISFRCEISCSVVCVHVRIFFSDDRE
jgi:hypothetical protein